MAVGEFRHLRVVGLGGLAPPHWPVAHSHFLATWTFSIRQSASSKPETRESMLKEPKSQIVCNLTIVVTHSLSHIISIKMKLKIQPTLRGKGSHKQGILGDREHLGSWLAAIKFSQMILLYLVENY